MSALIDLRVAVRLLVALAPAASLRARFERWLDLSLVRSFSFALFCSHCFHCFHCSLFSLRYIVMHSIDSMVGVVCE